MDDVFRPRHEPARTLYDAFQDQAEHRNALSANEWMEAEVVAVWTAARDYAQMHSPSFRVVTLKEVRDASLSASGHTDFGAKWAYAVAQAMRTDSECGK